MRRLGGVLGVLLAASAAGQEVEWRAIEVLRFSDAPPEIAFARISDIAVDGRGRFYVLDAMNSQVYVFAPDGGHERTIGRRGAGPGEFGSGVDHLAIAGDYLIVHDSEHQRISVFSLDGSLLSDFRVNPMVGRVSELGGLGDGSFVLQRDPGFAPPDVPRDARAISQPVLLHVSRDGAVLDTIERFRTTPLIEFTATGTRNHFPDDLPVWTVDATGRVVYGHTDRYLLRWWTVEGISAPWGRSVRREPVTETFRSRIRALQDSMAGTMRGARAVQMEFVFPDSLPVIAALRPGPFGTVLVRRTYGLEQNWPSPPRGTVDVFDGDGVFLGAWEPPRGFWLLAAHGDRLYGVERDGDDLDYVVVYRVERRR